MNYCILQRADQRGSPRVRGAATGGSRLWEGPLWQAERPHVRDETSRGWLALRVLPDLESGGVRSGPVIRVHLLAPEEASTVQCSR